MSRIMSFILAVLLLTVLALGCGPKEHTIVDAVIRGTVVDKADGTPIDSARVLLRAFSWWGELYKTEQVTEADGRFLFPINPHHLHVLEVTKDGYVGVTLRVEGGGYLPDVALERKESMGPPVTVDITRAGANGTQAVAALADPRQRHGRGRRGRS